VAVSRFPTKKEFQEDFENSLYRTTGSKSIAQEMMKLYAELAAKDKVDLLKHVLPYCYPKFASIEFKQQNNDAADTAELQRLLEKLSELEQEQAIIAEAKIVNDD